MDLQRHVRPEAVLARPGPVADGGVEAEAKHLDIFNVLYEQLRGVYRQWLSSEPQATDVTLTHATIKREFKHVGRGAAERIHTSPCERVVVAYVSTALICCPETNARKAIVIVGKIEAELGAVIEILGEVTQGHTELPGIAGLYIRSPINRSTRRRA